MAPFSTPKPAKASGRNNTTRVCVEPCRSAGEFSPKQMNPPQQLHDEEHTLHDKSMSCLWRIQKNCLCSALHSHLSFIPFFLFCDRAVLLQHVLFFFLSAPHFIPLILRLSSFPAFIQKPSKFFYAIHCIHRRPYSISFALSLKNLSDETGSPFIRETFHGIFRLPCTKVSGGVCGKKETFAYCMEHLQKAHSGTANAWRDI